MMARTNRNAERGAATREQFIAVATRLFAERGYDDTSIESVLQATGASRGSLYHHFKGKDALFEAVLEAVESDVGQRTAAAAVDAPDAFETLRAGCLAWVRIAGDPVVQRILLIDAPSVLGWERWRELEERHALGSIKAILGILAQSGRLAPDLVDMFAHVLLASVNEIALMIARSDDQPAAGRSAAEAVDEILTRLLGPPAAASVTASAR
jgi:AcrR family transcriptional regulator